MEVDEENWVSSKIANAADAFPVDLYIVSTLKEKLSGVMSERLLRASEVTELADELVFAVLARVPEDKSE